MACNTNSRCHRPVRQPPSDPPDDSPEGSPYSGCLGEDYKAFSDPALLKVFLQLFSSLFVNRAGNVALFSQCSKCYNSSYCELAKKVDGDSIIIEIVNVRNDAWKVISRAFNISEKTKKKIDENCSDDYIKCEDLMHRMYHHDDSLTWGCVESQVRRNDPHLADVIRNHL